jgi:hypothetical protein
MSEIGRPCERALWYSFRWAEGQSRFDADTLKRFEDGHAGEDLQIKRIRMVDGITLLNVDPDTGQQFEFVDYYGHFKGHMDGVILGLPQAPKTWHVYEHKVCNDKKLNQLTKLKREVGEKNALRHWDAVYYAQAVLYMDYAQLERHYLTVSSPGGRQTISCRTEADPVAASSLKEKAARIIESSRAPVRISGDPSWYECKWCDHHAVCHQGTLPPANCRTCLYSTADAGEWLCSKWGKGLSLAEQREGCPSHLYLPSLVDGEQIDAADDGAWVEYRLPNGEIWRNGAAS